MNCDDFEVVNPLGSHVKKHKLTAFYFTLANIPPEYRSKTSSIQLLAICKARDIHADIAAEKCLLQDFTTTLNEMAINGIIMAINDRDYLVRGTLVIAPCDTLAAQWLGKFKEGVSFALKNCRRCEVENSHKSSKYVESEVALRTGDCHKERCQQLIDINPQARIYWSKVWGINGSSVLLNIAGFDLLSGLVQDPMHVLLEGVVPYELSEVLYFFIYVRQYFTLKWLNSAILGFKFSYLQSKTKPEQIEKRHIDGTASIKQTAGAMLTLFEILPIIIGTKVPENSNNWLNTLRLLQIVQICTSPICKRETASLLRILIAEYLSTFRKLYPKASFLPKMHYMIHFPGQMLMYGPLRHHWCMLFEGKNGILKSRKYTNFINISSTIAKHHQLHMAYHQMSPSGERATDYLYSGDNVSEGDVNLSDTNPEVFHSLRQLTMSDNPSVYVTSSVTIHGLEYRAGCALVLQYEDDEPEFGILLNILIVDNTQYFLLQSQAVQFEEHIISYIVLKPTGQKVLPYASITFKWPLPVYQYGQASAIMNKYSYTCPII